MCGEKLYLNCINLISVALKEGTYCKKPENEKADVILQNIITIFMF